MVNLVIQRILTSGTRCVLCLSPSNAQICLECYQSLCRPLLKPHCHRCLVNLPPKEIICHNCKENNFYFDRIIAAFTYATPLSKVLHKLKYHGQLEYSSLLSQLFWAEISKRVYELPEVIIPVPLHPNKHKLRGFNQVYEILREFRQLNPQIPIIKFKRIKDTANQALLTRNDRAENLANAFYAGNIQLTGQYVVIVDDVVTTATTVNELAKLCKNLGATKVDIWCLMRAEDKL